MTADHAAALVNELLAHREGAERTVSSPELGARLRALHAEAMRSIPGVNVDATTFVAYLGARLPRDLDVETGLGRVCLDDLLLACACLAGDPAATQRFDERLSSMVERTGARMRQPAWVIDEIKQVLRERLLVQRPGAAARLGEYAGLGALTAWLRVVVVRTFISFHRANKSHEGTLDDARILAELPCADPELALVRQRHASDVEAAFRAALASLTPRQGAVLRLYVLERMLPAQIAAIYGVDRSTVVRWLQSIYASLLEKTRDDLRARLRLTDTGMSSLLRAMHSHLHDEVEALLKAGASD